MAVADAYDAITSERPYREAMSPQIAYNIIERCKGSQFDPEVADTFLRIKKYSKLDKICQYAKD
jgi:HD-GYP domain-containing protein (c-di-GMP phosphodiesterase class II)